MKPASSRPRDIAPHGRGQHVLPDQLTGRKSQRVIVADTPKREGDTSVLLPEPQRGVRLGLDLGSAPEGTPDNIPAILVGLAKIGIRKVGYPVLLVGGIASICEFAVPSP